MDSFSILVTLSLLPVALLLRDVPLLDSRFLALYARGFLICASPV
jgi:hypothetical protein